MQTKEAMKNLSFRLCQKAKDFYKYLAVNEKTALFCLFFLVILTRLPWLLFISNDNPGDDSAFFINIGKNIAEGNGYTSDFKEYFYKNDGLDGHTSIGDHAFWAPPVYPAFLAIVFTISYSAYAAKIAQTILFGIFMCLFYKYTKLHFNTKIAFLSSLLIVFDPLFYYNSIWALSDIISLFLIILTLYLLTIYEIKGNVNYLYLAGAIAALAGLTREVNLVLLPIVVGFFLYKKNYNDAIKFSTSYMVILLPWYIYQYVSTGYLMPRFASTRDFPRSPLCIESCLDKMTPLGRVLFTIREDWALLVVYYFTSGTVVILFPFMILAIIKMFFYPHKNYTFSLLVALAFSVVYAVAGPLVGIHSNDRYYFPVYIIILPIALQLFFNFIQNISAEIQIRRNSLVAIFIALSIVISSGSILNTAYTNITSEDETQYATFEWLSENASEDDLIASTNPQRLTYYTELTCIRLPRNVDDVNLDEFLSIYNISYIHFSEIQAGRFLISYNWVAEIYEGTDIISLENHNLILVHKETFSSNSVWLYSVEDN